MKIIYISSIAFSDVDLSFLEEMQKIADVTYVLQLTQYNLASCAFDFRGITLDDGITCAANIPQLLKYKSVVDLNRFYIFKTPAAHGYELRAFKYNRLLRSFIKEGNYDIVHLTSVPSLFNIPLLSLRRKVLLTVHDPIPHSTDSYTMDSYNRKISFSLFNYILLFNKAQKEEFVDYYGLRKRKIKIYVSRLSSYNYLHIYNQESITNNKYILFFGNITAYKGLEYLFEAMSIVHNQHPELKLVVAGRGDYYFDTKKYEELGCFDIRNYFIADDELAKLVAGSMFVVIPYVDATQSGVAMTAYAFNKPCIATNVGGLPEMVVDGKYGIVVPPKDIQSLADAMNKMIETPEMQEEFSNNIQKDYHEGDKSWKKTAEEMLSIYKEIEG